MQQRNPLWKGLFVLGWIALIYVFGVGCSALHTDEPQYAGKPLSFWLHQLNETKKFNLFTGSFDINEDAARAVKEIGEVAVPFLINELCRGTAGANEYDRIGAGHLPEAERRKVDMKALPAVEAELGFKALGERGSKAVPALTALMWQEQDSSYYWILDSLADVGASAVPTFRLALISTNRLLRYHAASATGSLGGEGASLVPLLIGLVTNSDSISFERDFSARSLGRIGKPSEVILPFLCDCLTSTNETFRDNVCLGLMFMGKKAELALPQIEAHLKTRSGELDRMILAAFSVLCSDDKRIVTALEHDFYVGTEQSNTDGSPTPSTFGEIISVVRQSWIRADRDALEAMRASLAKIQPLKERK